jgi:hypothetical protein
MPHESARSFALEVETEPDGFILSLDALTPAGDFLTGSSGRVLMMDPADARHEIPLESKGPGRYEARVPARLRGNYHFDVQLVPPGPGDPIREYVTATIGFPEEYLLRPPDTDLLKSLAAKTGGRFDPALPAAFFEDDGRSVSREHPIWPWLAGLALFLFLLDVTAKRLPSPLFNPLTHSRAS